MLGDVADRRSVKTDSDSVKMTLFLPSVDALMASETIQIATDGLNHSCVCVLHTAAALLSGTQTGFIRSSQLDK